MRFSGTRRARSFLEGLKVTSARAGNSMVWPVAGTWMCRAGKHFTVKVPRPRHSRRPPLLVAGELVDQGVSSGLEDGADQGGVFGMSSLPSREKILDSG